MIPKIFQIFLKNLQNVLFYHFINLFLQLLHERERERERENAMGTPYGMRHVRGTPYDMSWEIHNSPQKP